MTIATELSKGLLYEYQILNEAYKVLREQLGSRTARYYFYHDRDFVNDIVTEYRFLQKQENV